jgi:hypothetical protein
MEANPSLVRFVCPLARVSVVGEIVRAGSGLYLVAGPRLSYILPARSLAAVSFSTGAADDVPTGEKQSRQQPPAPQS